MQKMLVALVAIPVFTAVLGAADLSGVWTIYFNPDFGGEQGQSAECTFKQDGTKLTVRCGAGEPGNGDVEGQKVTFHMATGQHNELSVTFVSDLDQRATTMTGTWHFVDQNKKDVNGKFEARKN